MKITITENDLYSAIELFKQSKDLCASCIISHAISRILEKQVRTCCDSKTVMVTANNNYTEHWKIRNRDLVTLMNKFNALSRTYYFHPKDDCFSSILKMLPLTFEYDFPTVESK